MRVSDDRVCERVRAMLQDYLDGRLAGGRARTVEHHLQGCALCRRELKELRALVGVLQQMPTPVPTDHFWPRLAARLQAAGPPPARQLRQRAWLPAAVLALLVLLGTFFATRPSRIATPVTPVESYANQYFPSDSGPAHSGIFLPAGNPPGYPAEGRTDWR